MKNRLILLASLWLLPALACNLPREAQAEEISPSTELQPTHTLVTTLYPSPTLMMTATQTMAGVVEPLTDPFTSTPSPLQILGEHRVAAGETLLCIGRVYGVLPEAITQVNDLDLSAFLAVGQVLKVPAVQWSDILPGPVCAPQFSSPFPGLPTPTVTLIPVVMPTDTPRPILSTATPTITKIPPVTEEPTPIKPITATPEPTDRVKATDIPTTRPPQATKTPTLLPSEPPTCTPNPHPTSIPGTPLPGGC